MTYPTSGTVYSPKLRESAVVRRFISQNGSGYLSLSISDGAEFVDAVPGTVKLRVYRRTVGQLDTEFDDPRGELVINVDDTSGSDTIARDDVGMYHYNIGPAQTGDRGLLTAEWSYQVGDDSFKFTDNLAVMDQMPAYDRLKPEYKAIIDSAYWMFGDLFDSTEGGPFLIENFQSHFHPERMTHLLGQAVMRFNTLGLPLTTFGLTVNEKAVPQSFHGILIWGLRLEVIRHLCRSYVEIPLFTNMNVTYTDRRDYLQRWQSVLQEEKPDFEKALITAKRSLMKLGRGALLVSGGPYFGTGGGRGVFFGSMYSAQVRSTRFYPAAPAISWFNSIGRH